MTRGQTKGAEIVRATFGGSLYQQGRGFYAALELLAILRGEILLDEAEKAAGTATGRPSRLLPTSGPTEYLRHGHDHARRLLSSDDEVVPGVFVDERTRAAVRSLLEGLEVPVPGRRRTNERWQKRHLYPYPAEAIHYDAVQRGNRISIETYFFRGGGGLAHRMLRTDPDTARLDDTRRRFAALLSDGDGAVGQLLRALAAHDNAKPDPAAPFRDRVEEASLIGDEDFPDGPAARPTRWTDLLREGTNRILAREELSSFERIDALVHWVPWCLARHQLCMASRVLGRDEDEPLVFDVGHGKSPVRTLAQEQLTDAQKRIGTALETRARASGAPELAGNRKKWSKESVQFYATTLFAVGALNANTGRRHHELRPELLQTLVHTLVDEPVTYHRFVRETLGERCRIVCDKDDVGLASDLGLDGEDLAANGRSLRTRLDEVGLARSFSDSTVMVGARP